MRSRGLRNHNPGNIRRTSGRGVYRGEVEQPTDPEFRQFVAPKWGYRALFVVLYTYEIRHRLRTPRQMISRWAPPTENHTETYIRFVCEQTGLSPDTPISALDPKIMLPFGAAISEMENGEKASWEDLEAGWELFFRDYGPKSTKKR